MLSFLKKVFLLVGEDKRKLPFLLFLFLSSSLLDIIGVGLIGPFVMLIANPESLDNVAAWQSFTHFLGIEQRSESLLFLSGVILVAFYLKACVAYNVEKAIFKFSQNTQRRLIKTFLDIYLHAPYEFHLKRNSADIQNVVSTHTDSFAKLSLIPLLRLISNLTIVAALLILLAVTHFAATVTIGVILGAVLLFYHKGIKRIAYRYGKEAAEAKGNWIREINHCLHGFKEVKVLACEDHFLEEVDHNAKVHAKAMASAKALEVMPRYLLESVLVTFVVGFSGIVLLWGSTPENILATLSIFGAAAIRLLPATNQIGTSLSNISQSKFYVDYLTDDFKLLNKYTAELSARASLREGHQAQQPFKTLQLEQVAFTYPTAMTPAVANINVHVSAGQSIAIVGQSGAGKTTLVDIILGLLTPQTGTIYCNGKAIHDDIVNWRQRCAYIPQNISLIDNTLRHNIALGMKSEDIDDVKIAQVLAAAQLERLVAELPEGLNTIIGEQGVRLSGGQRQRVGIARALYYGRDVLIMDEATSALDNETEKEVIKSIDSLKGTYTVIVIAHRLSTIEHCDKVYRLDKGQIIQSGSFQEVISDSTHPKRNDSKTIEK